jgi:hypothetical protein
MMTYALGRSVEAHDMPAVRNIVRLAADDNYSFSSIIEGVIASDQFQKMTIPADGVQVGSL